MIRHFLGKLHPLRIKDVETFQTKRSLSQTRLQVYENMKTHSKLYIILHCIRANLSIPLNNSYKEWWALTQGIVIFAHFSWTWIPQLFEKWLLPRRIVDIKWHTFSRKVDIRLSLTFLKLLKIATPFNDECKLPKCVKHWIALTFHFLRIESSQFNVCNFFFIFKSQQFRAEVLFEVVRMYILFDLVNLLSYLGLELFIYCWCW